MTGRRRLHGALAVAAAVVLGLAVRLPFLADPLEPDEAGYLLVARQWDLLAPQLYGALWVDRPPLLILLFRASDGLGSYGVRVLGLMAVAVLVASAGACGAFLSGRRGAVVASTVAGTLASSYAIGGQEVDGELLGVPLVMVCCMLTLAGMRLAVTARGRVAVGLLGGVAGMAAVLVKQNLVDGLVFACVLLVMSLATGRGGGRRRAGDVLIGGTLGIVVVLSGVVAWAGLSGIDLGALSYAVYGFRLEAADVVRGGDLSRPVERAALLSIVAMLSGLVAVLTVVLRRAGSGLRRGEPMSVAVLVMLVYGMVGIVAGGSYWTHYLVELVPVAVLGLAHLIRDEAEEPRVRRLAVGVVAAAVMATAVGVGLGARTGGPEATATTTGTWLRLASRPGDRVMVTYGHPDLVLDSGLATTYPYLWSLPLRVRDPKLDRLIGNLESDRAPTWLVEWDDFDSWGLDSSGRLSRTVRVRYRVVARVCDHSIWLRDGAVRRAPRHLRGACGDL